jgi:hypothetical protein
MTRERDERLGLNEALFRDVNERLQELGETFGVDGERTDFICECGDPACTERISLTLSEYEQVRAEATHFAVRPRHVDPSIEVVVSENERYSIVEKRDPDSVRVVEKLDPRSRSNV